MEPIHLQLRRRICRAIVDGIWGPGERLPSRQQLAQEYRVSLRSLQHCVDELTEEGHLISHGGHGTLVTDSPPCLYDIALITPEEVGPGLSNSLRQVADSWTGRERIHCLPSESLERLESDLRYHRYRGAVIQGELDGLSSTRQAALQELPVVLIAFMNKRFARLHLDLFASVEWGIEHLAAQGYRRIAVMNAQRSSGQLQERIRSCLRRLSCVDDPRLLLEIGIRSAHSIPGLLALLWSIPKQQRPQALLIGDDHLVPAVTQHLAQLPGARRLPVLAHANHPQMSPSHLPAQRYGFRASDVLAHACAMLAGCQQQPAALRTLQPGILQ